MNDPDRLQHPPLTADTNLTPERSRSLIAWQRQEAASELSVDPAPFLISWGVVWLIGFGAFYFATAPDHLLPLWAAGVVMGALAAAAVLWMVNDLVRRGQGVTGPSKSRSVRYAWSWPIALGGILVFDAGLTYQGLPPALAPLLWPASCMVVAGGLYLAGGVGFADRAQYGIGVWALAVGAASVFAGSPGNFAVLALAGGGGLLATAALILLGRRHRSGEARP